MFQPGHKYHRLCVDHDTSTPIIVPGESGKIGYFDGACLLLILGQRIAPGTSFRVRSGPKEVHLEYCISRHCWVFGKAQQIRTPY